MKLPTYNPEASDLEEAVRPMSSDELIKRYGISKSQFHNRKNKLPHIQGFTQGKKKHFGPSEIYQLDAVHFYVSAGYSLDDIQDAYEGAEPELQDSSTFEVAPLNPTPKADPNQLGLSITPQMTEFSEQMGAMVVQAVEKIAKPVHDPLRCQRLLKEAAVEQFPLTSKILAEILELRLSTVHSMKSGDERLGFRMNKIGVGKWKVERLAA